jgi:hypothetical protein
MADDVKPALRVEEWRALAGRFPIDSRFAISLAAGDYETRAMEDPDDTIRKARKFIATTLYTVGAIIGEMSAATHDPTPPG